MSKIEIERLSTKELLDTRIKDLKLDLPEVYQNQIDKLHIKLKAKNILWSPYLWAGDEWFSPDGLSGLAYCFTLCHPKLIKLEKEYLGFCEGEKPSDFFKLLCHETGHAIDNAFKLRLNKKRQSLFGLSSTSYPQFYRPNPNSKDYVKHLSDFYAQAHPDEDWAETFAVWLSSDNWKQKYKKTKALGKLQYIDELMKTLKCPKITKRKYRASENDTRTVRQYLQEKRNSLKLNRRNFYRTKLNQNLFATKGVSVASFITKNQKRLIASTSRDSWITEKCLKELKEECKKKKYKLKYNEKASEKLILNIIESHYDEFIKKGRTRVYM